MALEGACAPGLPCLSVLSSHQSFNACEGCLMRVPHDQSDQAGGKMDWHVET